MKGSFLARFPAHRWRRLSPAGVVFVSLSAIGTSGIAFTPGCSGSAEPIRPLPTTPSIQASTAPQASTALPVNTAPPAQPPAPPSPAAPPATQPTPQPAPPPAPPASTASAPPRPPPTPPPLPPAPPIQKIGVTDPACVLKGTSPVAKGTQLYDVPTNGRSIASFTGNHAPMALSEIPANPVNDRSRLATSTGTGSLRLEGYVATSAIPVYSTRDISIMAPNVSITSAQKVKLMAATSSSVTVEMTLSGSNNQSVRGTTTCDALALQRGTPTPMQAPGNGRGYLTKESSTDVYNRPNGDVIFTFRMIDGSSRFFWSTETKAGFVHVQSRNDLAIDAWIRWKDLDPLKPGEMMDQYIPPSSQVAGAQLAFEKPPRVATATREIPIRPRRDEKERPIGVVEAGAEIYVLETVAGWTNVLPKSLYVLPPEDGGFWILSSDVPK